MSEKKMITVSLRLTPLQSEQIEKLAGFHQTSKSKVIRQALDFYWRFGPKKTKGIWSQIIKIMSDK